MPQPDLKELISIIEDDYKYVRINGKWNTTAVTLQKSATSLKDNLYSAYQNYVAPYISGAKLEPSDTAYLDITQQKLKKCTEVKAELERAAKSQDYKQWIKVCINLGASARAEGDEGLLCKALHTKRILILEKIKSEQVYIDHINELKNQQTQSISTITKLDNEFKEIKAEGYKIPPEKQKKRDEQEHLYKTITLELADLGEKYAIIEARERNWLPYLKCPDASYAPLFPYNPASPGAVERNIHMPLAYQSCYPKIFRDEIDAEKQRISLAIRQAETQTDKPKSFAQLRTDEANVELVDLDTRLKKLETQLTQASTASVLTNELKEAENLISLNNKAMLNLENTIKHALSTEKSSLEQRFLELSKKHDETKKSYELLKKKLENKPSETSSDAKTATPSPRNTPAPSPVGSSTSVLIGLSIKPDAITIPAAAATQIETTPSPTPALTPPSVIVDFPKQEPAKPAETNKRRQKK